MVIEIPLPDTDNSTEPKDDAVTKDDAATKEETVAKLTKERDKLLILVAEKQKEVSESIKDGKNALEAYNEYMKSNPGYPEFRKGTIKYDEYMRTKEQYQDATGIVDTKQAEMISLKADLGSAYEKLASKEKKISQSSNDNYDTSSQTSSNKSQSTYTPAEPKMGGLIDTYQGPEAWTGGKPTTDWTNLDPRAKKTPLPTQI